MAPRVYKQKNTNTRRVLNQAVMFYKIQFNLVYIQLPRCFSGVATGWHGWTMSRGPRAKGAPRERQKNQKKKKRRRRIEKKKKETGKERKKSKERTKLFKYPDAPPPDISPWVKVDDRKYQNQILIIITQSLKYRRNNGGLGLHVPVFFSS